MKEKITLSLLVVLFLSVLVFIVVALSDSLFRDCNADAKTTVEYWDIGIGATSHAEICANGSHWFWENDPLKSQKASR